MYSFSRFDCFDTFSGSLKNNFDKDKVQNEIDLQVKVTQEFRSNVQHFQAEQNKRKDELKAKLERNEISQKDYDEQISRIQKQSLLVNMIAGGLTAPSDSVLGIATSTVSPAVSFQVGQHFKKEGKEGSFEHIATHAVIGALTSAANGGNALSGAVSAGGAEYIAQVTAETLFQKDANELTADEKQTVSSIAQLVGVVSGSVTGDSSANAYIGGTVASTAVDNNFLTAPQLIQVEKDYLNCGNDEACKQRVLESARIKSAGQDMRLSWEKLECAFGDCDDLHTMNQAWVDSLNVGKVAQELQRQYPNMSYEDALLLAERYSAEADSSFNKSTTRLTKQALEDLPIIGGLGGTAVKSSGRAVTQTFAKQAERKAAKKATDAAKIERKVETNFYRDGSPATPPLLHPDIARLQGTSPNVGDFTGLRGATMEEIVSRVPKDWTVAIQKDGKGVRFLDTTGNERVRVHQADYNAPVGSNSNSGWVLRVSNGGKGKKAQYYDHNGNVGGYKDNDTHIPVYGNPVLNKGGKK